MENEYLAPRYRLRCTEVLYSDGYGPNPCDPTSINKVKEHVKQHSAVYRGLHVVKGFRGNLRDLQTVQNKPGLDYLRQILKTTEKAPRPVEVYNEPPPFKPTKGYKRLETKPSEILPRPRTDRFLIRRPTTKSPAPPIHQDDLLFRTFTKQMVFKLKNFATTKEQYYFYQSNFPLLLDHQKEGEQITKIPKKRARSPENVISPELKRGIQLKRRLFDLKKEVDELEKESDCEFETELRKGMFDPTTYPWNKKKRPFPLGKASAKSKDFLRKALWSPV